MNIEKRIEDLCLERLRLERTLLTDFPNDSIEEQAKAEAQRQIRQAKIEAIDTQLEGLRKDYARGGKKEAERLARILCAEKKFIQRWIQS